MLSLLPEWHGIHSPTAAPRFEDWKPGEITVTHGQWRGFVAALLRRLMEDAGGDPGRWRALLENSSSLGPVDRLKLRDELGRRVEQGDLADEGRGALWEAIRKLIASHREFSRAEWALPADDLAALEAIEQRLRPRGAVDVHAWLFEEHMPDLGDGTKMPGGEYDHQSYVTKLTERRRAAVERVARTDGWDGVIELTRRAIVPWAVGDALAEVDNNQFEVACLASLESEEPHEIDLATGYFSRRFSVAGWKWLEPLTSAGTLSPTQIACLLLLAPDYPRSWEQADELGEDVAREYWKRFGPFGLGPDFPLVEETVRRLLRASRPAAALRLLTLYARDQSAQRSLGVVAADALQALLDSQHEDPEIRTMREYDFATIFTLLESEKSEVGAETVARLEWAYLPALGHEPAIPSLNEALVQSPSFFVDVVSAIYRRRSDKETREATPDQVQTATNAYALLSSWHRLPGTTSDGRVNSGALEAWFKDVIPLLDQADRRGVGEIHIGHVLAFAPSDSDGAWPCIEVREFLERAQSDQIEQGLQTQIFNNRGITSRDPHEGGDQERALATRYREAAQRFNDRWPRTASILRALADTYDDDARGFDAEAELVRSGLDR